MIYLLDTNILLFIIRDEKNFWKLDAQLNLFSGLNNASISVVTVGEIKSISLRNDWGDKKLAKLSKMLDELIVVDINAEDIIDAYAEIDAYSQGKLKSKPLKMTSRNMGKNDLWIAATAHVLNANLLTTDHDFDHLHDSFLDLIRIER